MIVELRGPKRRNQMDQPSSYLDLLTVPELVGYTIDHEYDKFDRHWKSEDTGNVQTYINTKNPIIKDDCRPQ